MIPFARRDKPHALAAGMAGAKMGDRVVQIGCAHGSRLAAIAAPVGLSGRAVAIVDDEAAATRARKGAAQAGVLVEVEVAAPTALPLEAGAFDVAVVDDTGGLLANLSPEQRTQATREIARVLRPGGRVMVMSAIPRGGLGALFTRAQSGPPLDVSPWLQSEGFKSIRVLAEREGLRFVEAIKPRTPIT
jgi:ubiquinone/menaquinone biosynthesis C-methylase UbiE